MSPPRRHLHPLTPLTPALPPATEQELTDLCDAADVHENETEAVLIAQDAPIACLNIMMRGECRVLKRIDLTGTLESEAYTRAPFGREPPPPFLEFEQLLYPGDFFGPGRAHHAAVARGNAGKPANSGRGGRCEVVKHKEPTLADMAEQAAASSPMAKARAKFFKEDAKQAMVWGMNEFSVQASTRVKYMSIKMGDLFHIAPVAYHHVMRETMRRCVERTLLLPVLLLLLRCW